MTTVSHQNVCMKSHVVVDGEVRLRESPEFQAKLRALRDSINARYAAEFSCANFFRRCIIRWRMAMAYRRERRQIVPSSQSLYSSGIVAGRTQE